VVAHVVVDALEGPVVPVDGGERAAQGGPAAVAVPGHVGRRVLQVGHERHPDREHEPGREPVLHERAYARGRREDGEPAGHGGAGRDAAPHAVARRVGKERPARVEVRAVARRPVAQQVERKDQQEGAQPHEARRGGQRADLPARERGPGRVALHVAHVGMVRPVREAPGVVGHEQRRVHQVPHRRVPARPAREGAVAAVVPDQEEGPEECPLEEDDRREPGRAARRHRSGLERREPREVGAEVGAGAQRGGAEAVRGDRLTQGAPIDRIRRVATRHAPLLAARPTPGPPPRRPRSRRRRRRPRDCTACGPRAAGCRPRSRCA